MDSPPKPFPLSRFAHHNDYYYPFGNTPAEDFLRSVAIDPAKPTRPTILSLGCGDIRSCMYTLWKNFEFEGKSVSGFAGVDFVLNDCSAAVLARNILFLYLCLRMPEDGDSQARKEWVASVWAIWYNHELTPEHDQVLSRALAQLLQWSGTEQEWAQCRLGIMVRFSSTATFRAVKQMWALWHGRGVRVESVEAMKLVRLHHLQETARALHISDDERRQKLATEFLSPVHFHCDYSQEIIDTMVKEWSTYAVDGSVFAEVVLGLAHSTAETTVNMTLFEHVNGTYTLHPELAPYWAFHHACVYSPVEVSRMTEQSEAILPLLPVADEYFKVAPLQANCVQQFAMWLTATAKMMKHPKDCKFTFDCSDAISFCQTLFQFPEQYSHNSGLSELAHFDAIYTSSLLDLFFGALVLVTVALLKPDGALFTTSFQYKTIDKNSNEYIERIFSFPPELLPVILGIRCIGHDGQYSSTVAPQPIPPYADPSSSPQPVPVSLVWKNITSHPLKISSLMEETQFLHHFLKSYLSAINETVDIFLAILNHFTATLHMKILPSHQFWEPLCMEIMKEPILKPHLIQLQTQSLLHGLHMHITITEADCPLCTGQPLDDYIGGYTIHLSSLCTGFFEKQLFSVHLQSGSNDVSVITSIAGSSNGPNVQLDFFIPKHCAKMFQSFTVYKTTTVLGTRIPDNAAVTGKLQDISSYSPRKYFFMKNEKAPTSDIPISEIIKHSGDATRFKTTVSIADMCTVALERTTLRAERTEIRKLQVRYGQRFCMTITYPYPIQSNVDIILSKKNRTILIAAERAITCPYNDDPTLYTDPNNALALPHIQCRDQRIMFHFILQTPLPTIDPAGPFYMKSVLIQLAENASKEHIAVALLSQCIPGYPSIYGMIIVHKIHCDPYFRSSVINISFCFPHCLPKTSLPAVTSFWEQLTHREYCIMWVDDEKYKILNKALSHFAAMSRKTYRNPGIPPALAKHEGWQYFQQALIHPLYPNTQLSHVSDTLATLLSAPRATNSMSNVYRSSSPSEVEKQFVETNSKCTYCEQTRENLKKCGGCGKVQYCGKECQIKHWKEHKSVCKLSSNETASIIYCCTRCKKQAKLRRCSCQSVAYCSKECQKLDWPSHQESCSSQRKTSLKPTANSMADISRQYEENSQLQSAGSIGAKLQDNTSDGKCSSCNKVFNKQLKRCPCHKVVYCSIECQRLHWPLHKDMCSATKK